MIELKMIDTKLLNTDKSEEERELLREIWRLLGGESTDEQIICKSIRNFICIILNYNKNFLYFPDMSSIDNKHFDENTVGIISRDGVFYIKDRKEIKKIHRSFYIFCLNRFNNLSSIKRDRRHSEPKPSNENSSKFAPKILKRSKQMDKKRNAVSKTSRRHDLLLKIGEEYIKSKSKLSNASEAKEFNDCTFKPEVKSNYKHKLNKIETPNTIVSLNEEGFHFEQSIEDIKFSRKRQNKSPDKQVFIDGQLNMKIIKNPTKQKDPANVKTQINDISLKGKAQIQKNSINNRAILPKVNKPKDYNGKLGIFKSKVPMPYKPIPVKFPAISNGEIKISAPPIERPPSQPAENKPTELSRNKELENVRGQVQASITEGDEVLFKSVSSLEENSKDISENIVPQEDSNINIRAAQDLLNSTKRRIDEIEKDLKMVNNIESSKQTANTTPKTLPKIPPLNKDQLKVVKGEKSGDSQLNRSNNDPLTERVEIDESQNQGQTHFSKLLYQGRKSPKDDSQEDSEINLITESPVNSKKKRTSELSENSRRQKEEPALSDKNDEQEDEEDEEDDSQIPLLFVDVNLGKGVMKRIILYEGDDPKYIAEMFAKDNKLEENMKSKLERLLKKTNGWRAV